MASPLELLLIADAAPGAWAALPGPARVLPAASIDAVCHALGTGRTRRDVAAVALALCAEGGLRGHPALDDLLFYASCNREPVVDFFTEKERPKGRVHLFGEVSGREGSGDLLLGLVAELSLLELPVALHLVLDGAPGAPRSVQVELDALCAQIEGKATLATVVGRARLTGADGGWESLLDYHHAVVMEHEGRTAETPREALSLAYDAGEDDATVSPTRMEGYLGAIGDLCAEFGDDDPAPPVWEWYGSEVALFAFRHGWDLGRLDAVFARRDLPEEIAARLTTRGRAVFAFRPEHVARLSPLGARKDRVVVDTACAGQTLAGRAAAAGCAVARASDAAHGALARFVIEGEQGAAPVGEIDETALPGEALALLQSRVEGGARGLLIGVVQATPEAEASASALLAAVSEAGGRATTVLVEAGALRVSGAGGDSLEAVHEALAGSLAPP